MKKIILQKDLPKIITLNNFEEIEVNKKIYSKDKFEKYLKNFKIKQINFVTVKKKKQLKEYIFKNNLF